MSETEGPEKPMPVATTDNQFLSLLIRKHFPLPFYAWFTGPWSLLSAEMLHVPLLPQNAARAWSGSTRSFIMEVSEDPGVLCVAQFFCQF